MKVHMTPKKHIIIVMHLLCITHAALPEWYNDKENLRVATFIVTALGTLVVPAIQVISEHNQRQQQLEMHNLNFTKTIVDVQQAAELSGKNMLVLRSNKFGALTQFEEKKDAATLEEDKRYYERQVELAKQDLQGINEAIVKQQEVHTLVLENLVRSMIQKRIRELEIEIEKEENTEKKERLIAEKEALLSR